MKRGMKRKASASIGDPVSEQTRNKMARSASSPFFAANVAEEIKRLSAGLSKLQKSIVATGGLPGSVTKNMRERFEPVQSFAENCVYSSDDHWQDGDPLPCCGKIYNGEPCVMCDTCKRWFHIDCLGIDEKDLGDEYHCATYNRRRDKTAKHQTKTSGKTSSTRVAVACDVCNSRKVRCDGCYPCQTCRERKDHCSYNRQKHMKKPTLAPGRQHRRPETATPASIHGRDHLVEPRIEIWKKTYQEPLFDVVEMETEPIRKWWDYLKKYRRVLQMIRETRDYETEDKIHDVIFPPGCPKKEVTSCELSDEQRNRIKELCESFLKRNPRTEDSDSSDSSDSDSDD